MDAISVLVSDNYLLELVLVNKVPFKYYVGGLTAFLFSSSESLEPQGKKCRLWMGKGRALCEPQKNSTIEDLPFPN